MKKVFCFISVAVLTSSSLLAQKSSTFVESGKAIRGYDPVAYFTEAKPVMGYDSLIYIWNDAAWYFSSKENQKLFKEDPAKYAPQYGGYCAYGLSNGYKAPTEADAWTVENGKLYLNYNLQVKGEWNKTKKERIEKADKNWPVVKDKE